MSTFTLSAQKPVDFSGKWKLDLFKSDTIPGLISETLVIIQNGDEITINRDIETKSTRPIKGVFNYTVGKSVESNSKAGTNITSCEWSNDRQNLIITDIVSSEKNGVKSESKRVSTYSILDNGKKLTIISDDTYPDDCNHGGKGHLNQVFLKL